jgi:hypothetical protein
MAIAYGNNQCSTLAVKNVTFSAQSKHIDIRYKDAREIDWIVKSD